MIKEGIKKVIEGRDLSYLEAQEIMKDIMSGKSTNAQIASFLTALTMKKETIEEISAFAEIMRNFCLKIHPKIKGRLIDIVGTGGDSIKSFNISTVAAFVVAGSGIYIAKHGNRSFTSKCGSADVLEQLGYFLDTDPEIVEKSIEKTNIGFMYAPRHHPAMKYVLEPRKDIGIRTAFNILGPITNPAGANGFLLGVYDSSLTGIMASVLKNLECEEAMIVHGQDGLDEISTIGKTSIAWLKNEEIKMIEVSPKDFGIRLAKPEDIAGNYPEKNAELIFKILYGLYTKGNPKFDVVLINAAAGIMIGGLADSFEEAIELAKISIESGSAYNKLREMIKFSEGNIEVLEELEKKNA